MASDESPARRYQLTENLAKELSLREGQLIRTRVISRFPEENNKLVIDLNGRQVIARSRLDVEENQVLLLRVESLDRPIELSLFEPSEARDELTEDDLRSYLQTHRLNHSDESVEFLKSWLEESLPLDEQRFHRALDNRDLITGSDEQTTANRMWSFCFLEERGFPVDDETLELVGQLRGGGDKEAWTRFVVENADQLSLVPGGLDVRGGVGFVGFDMINRLGKRPHEASGTLHAMLLRAIKGQKTAVSAAPGLLKSLLGQILGVALVNLDNREEFLFFVPLLQDGKIELAWVGGRLKPGEPGGWYMNAYVTLSELGSIGVTAELAPAQLQVTLSTGHEATARLIRDRTDELKSMLAGEMAVAISVKTEDPGRGFNAFDLGTMSSTNTDASFSKGLDLTV